MQLQQPRRSRVPYKQAAALRGGCGDALLARGVSGLWRAGHALVAGQPTGYRGQRWEWSERGGGGYISAAVLGEE